MQSRKMLKSRKAISPILATLLLIVIAVAAIVVTYAWIMTYMGNAEQQAGIMLYKSNVNFHEQDGTKKIAIDVGNSGKSNTQLIRVYVGTSTTNMQNQTTTPSLPIMLSGESTATATVNYNWTEGATYHFRIIAASGQSLDFPEQAPA